MIKRYKQLNENERKLVNEFISRKSEKHKSLKELEDMFNNKIHDYGNGALFNFSGNKVNGKLNIVLEVADKLGTAFIYQIDLLDNNKETLKSIVGEAIKVAESYGATDIRLGTKDDNVIKLLNEIGLFIEYDSFDMVLEDRIIKHDCLGLTPLSEDNKKEYLRIYNEAFGDMPHGTVIDEEAVEEYLENIKSGQEYFLVTDNNENIGFLEVTIDDDEGYFDIGLCKASQGKGYGRRLLETAIDFLNKKDAKKINLTVIEENQRAYNMYKSRGFKVESVIHRWVKINL
ncbi:MAG: GNAT family N-acetyltransferase [Clostridium sp.]